MTDSRAFLRHTLATIAYRGAESDPQRWPGLCRLRLA